MNFYVITVSIPHIADTDVQMKPATTAQSVPVYIAKQKLEQKKELTSIAAITKMFRRHDVTLKSNPTCSKAVDNLDPRDFEFYDKDGFELNRAEQKFYAAMQFPIQYPILNHTCWQEPWFELETNNQGLILDHSMFLCRANYHGEAEEQLKELKSTLPLADYLLRTKIKWGYDFALDAVRDDHTFEVLHVEYDNNDFDHFGNSMIRFDWQVRHLDWQDAADRVWAQRDQWQQLKGFDQNHWKAEYLLGWKKSEYTEKAV